MAAVAVSLKTMAGRAEDLKNAPSLCAAERDRPEAAWPMLAHKPPRPRDGAVRRRLRRRAIGEDGRGAVWPVTRLLGHRLVRATTESKSERRDERRAHHGCSSIRTRSRGEEKHLQAVAFRLRRRCEPKGNNGRPSRARWRRIEQGMMKAGQDRREPAAPQSPRPRRRARRLRTARAERWASY